MKFSASITWMFREHPFLDRFDAARRAGFGGVEIQSLSEGDPRSIARAAQDAGIPVVLVNVESDYGSGGLGLSGVPGRETLFRDALTRTFDAAAIIGARFVHLGPSRIPGGTAREACLAVYRANLDLAADLSKGAGVQPLIEAMNRVDAPTALIVDVGEAAALIRERYSGRIGLQFDIYHVTMNGGDALASLAEHRDVVHHIQFADVPGRGEPGTGRIAFDPIFDRLAETGYQGWLGAEYQPTKPTAETLAWLERRRE